MALSAASPLPCGPAFSSPLAVGCAASDVKLVVPTSARRPTVAERLRCQAVTGDAVAEARRSAAPQYVPTPPDRELRTPHSGYHFDGTTRLFFEGWYFKVSIPECRQSFCFMYSVENPAFWNGIGSIDKAIHGHRFTGVGAQILGADEKYICQFTEVSKNFWGSTKSFTYLSFFW